MTDAIDVQQAFRDLEVQAQVHAKTLEMLKARVLSRFTVADHAQDAGSATEVGRLRGELATARDEARIAYDACGEADKVLAHTRTELADARGALVREREWRQTYQRRLSHAMCEVERLKASEAASAERERRLVNALRVSDEKRAEAERSRKVLTDQVAALHAWNPSDDAVQTMQGVLICMGEGRSAIRAGLRAAFVHDHLDACKPRT